MRFSRKNLGFTLVELMVAAAVALIVVASATTLMVSVMQSNAQNVASTRLTQELRALTEIIARDLRRARYNQSSMNFVGEAKDDDNGDGVVNASDWSPVNPYEAVSVSTGTAAAGDGDNDTVDGQCIRYAYEGAAGGAYRTVSRQVVNGVGAVVIAANAAASPACTANGTQLSSPQVNVRVLAFNYDNAVTSASPYPDDWVRVTVEGNLVSDPAVVRRFSELVRLKNQNL